MGVLLPPVFPQKEGDRLSIGGPKGTRFAQVNRLGLMNDKGRRPCFSSILCLYLVQGEFHRFFWGRFFREIATIVMKPSQIVPSPRLFGDHRTQGHNPTKVTDLFERGPVFAIIFRRGHAHGIKPAEHHKAFFPVGFKKPVKGWGLLRCRPVFWNRNPIRPGQPTVVTFLEKDSTLAMSLGIDTQDSLAILQKHCCRMTEILPLFPVHQHLKVPAAIQVELRDRPPFGQGIGVSNER